MAETTPQPKKMYWKRKGSYDVLRLLLEGRSTEETAQEVGWREDTVRSFICTPLFLNKIESRLKSAFLYYQIQKIIGLQKLWSLLFEVAMGQKQVKSITSGKAASLLVKLYEMDDEPKIKNPQEYNIITSLNKTESKELSLKEIRKQFGYEGLEEEPVFDLEKHNGF